MAWLRIKESVSLCGKSSQLSRMDSLWKVPQQQHEIHSLNYLFNLEHWDDVCVYMDNQNVCTICILQGVVFILLGRDIFRRFVNLYLKQNQLPWWDRKIKFNLINLFFLSSAKPSYNWIRNWTFLTYLFQEKKNMIDLGFSGFSFSCPFVFKGWLNEDVMSINYRMKK